ncbi:MAG TPA: hypothetical protein VFI24_24410 [Pyrinomonadaceae bacterium]|nr:hypothetical protein [Pyrinomonadaceae bacterium]
MFQDDLITLLDQFNIKSSPSFDKMMPEEKPYFVTRLYKCFERGLDNLGAELAQLRGLKLHYSRDLTSSDFMGTRLEDTFYKKLTFFTSQSVITCPIREESTHIRTSKSKRMADRERYDSAALRDLRAQGVYLFGDVKANQRKHGGEVHVRGNFYKVDRKALAELIETIISLREAIKHRLVYILPSLPDKQRELRAAFRQGKVTRGNFRREDLVRQFTERDLVPGDTHIDVGLARVYLPHITNIPLNRIIELRETEIRAYSDFQIALENFVHGSQSTASEAKILEFLRHLDEAIRSFRAEIERIQKKWKFTREELIVKSLALGFVALLPRELATAFMPFIGTITALDFLKSNREYQLQKSDAAPDEFYAVWKVDQFGK